jgi:hypothetical protein
MMMRATQMGYERANLAAPLSVRSEADLSCNLEKKVQ